MSQEINCRRLQLLKKPSEAPLISTIAVILQKYISIDKKNILLILLLLSLKYKNASYLCDIQHGWIYSRAYVVRKQKLAA